VWDYILSEEPSLKDRVIAFFKGAPKRYSFAPEMDAAAKKWIQEYKKLFDQVAESFRGKGNVLYFAQGLAPADIRELADRIAKSSGGIAAVFSGTDGAYQLAMIGEAGGIKALGGELNRQLNGRGGGKPGFFQGSVGATQQEIQEFFQSCGQAFL
jgi:alanyl-tRNA synthetase